MINIISLIISLCFLVINATSHHHSRIPNGDIELSITLSPTTSFSCGSSRVSTQYIGKQSIDINWEIEIAHEGECFIDLLTDEQVHIVGTLPNCVGEIEKYFRVNIQIPSHVTCKDHCMLRFRRLSQLTGETNYADVSIINHSNNSRNRVIKRTNNSRKGRKIVIPKNCILGFEGNLICR